MLVKSVAWVWIITSWCAPIWFIEFLDKCVYNLSVEVMCQCHYDNEEDDQQLGKWSTYLSPLILKKWDGPTIKENQGWNLFSVRTILVESQSSTWKIQISPKALQEGMNLCGGKLRLPKVRKNSMIRMEGRWHKLLNSLVWFWYAYVEHFLACSFFCYALHEDVCIRLVRLMILCQIKMDFHHV